ncbi:MAG: CAP domain-containing protein [bacterium]|nr:CAP domain-containing protein [bacterium]
MAKKKASKKYKDSDADGLTDAEEKKLGTDPKCPDSDKDGVCDYEEVKVYGTDPLNPDTDGDGMNDGQEIKRGRNPKGAGSLKDLFIPHAGNNYKPRVLHPHRLLFHAGSALLIKIVLIASLAALPIEAWLTPDILLEQSKKIIELTNLIRQNLNLTLLSENKLLNQAAADKAGDMLLRQYFAHAGPDGRKLSDWLKINNYNYAIAGENLAMGFSRPEEVVNGWSRSATHHKNMVDPDFTEIGVGLSVGPYKNYDTTFVAQYFGVPRIVRAAAPAEERMPAPIEALPAEELAIKTPEQSEVLGQDQISRPDDDSGPIINQDGSFLTVDRPAGQKSIVVKATASLSPDTAAAYVNFNNYAIKLEPDRENNGRWAGQAIIFDQAGEQIFNPVVLATLTVEDYSGNTSIADINWSNITPAKTSISTQYFFIKQHQPVYVKPLFDLTSIYYKILLALASASLALNIFIQYKKQHPHIILSTLGLIGLLAVLIII